MLVIMMNLRAFRAFNFILFFIVLFSITSMNFSSLGVNTRPKSITNSKLLFVWTRKQEVPFITHSLENKSKKTMMQQPIGVTNVTVKVQNAWLLNKLKDKRCLLLQKVLNEQQPRQKSFLMKLISTKLLHSREKKTSRRYFNENSNYEKTSKRKIW